MKSMILVLSPEEAAKLLNGDLSVLVRKEFPKDFIGWINVYVKKDRKNKLVQTWDTDDCGYGHYFVEAQVHKLSKPKKPKTPEPTSFTGVESFPIEWDLYYSESEWYDYVKENNDNGKVIANFWCDKVEEIETDYPPRDTFFKECGLTAIELFDYIGHSKWYAIHISKLEIFDRAKELEQFRKVGAYKQYLRDLKQAKKEDMKLIDKKLKELDEYGESDILVNSTELLECAWHLGAYGMTKAPQNYCYVEE